MPLPYSHTVVTVFRGIHYFFIVKKLFDFFFSNLYLLRRRMVVKIDLITHNIRNIGKIGRCILVKAYDLSKLIHALEISNHNAVKRPGSKINRYGISEFRPGQFADSRCNRNLIFVLRNYSIDIFIRGCFLE